jgi:hypothetical protein
MAALPTLSGCGNNAKKATTFLSPGKQIAKAAPRQPNKHLPTGLTPSILLPDGPVEPKRVGRGFRRACLMAPDIVGDDAKPDPSVHFIVATAKA